MDVICLQEYFKEGLRAVERVSSKHTTLPVLQNILIKTEESGLSFQATNLELGVFTLVPSKIKTKGSIAVPAKVLSDIVNNFPNEPVHLQVNKQNYTLNIECGDTKMKIKGSSDEEFPQIPKIKDVVSIEIPKNELIYNLQPLTPLISVSESRPEISGILFNFSGNLLTLAATDTFRLGERKIPIINQKQEGQYIVPLQCVQEIIRIFSAVDEEKIIFLVDNNHVEIRAGRTTLVSRLIDGNYPNYTHIIPESTQGETVILRDKFLQAARTASIFTSRLNDIYLSFDPKEKAINLKSEDNNKGSFDTKIETKETKGEINNIVFNWRYLIDGLESFKDENIIFSFCGEGKPGMIRPVKNKENQLYLLMPIKL